MKTNPLLPLKAQQVTRLQAMLRRQRQHLEGYEAMFTSLSQNILVGVCVIQHNRFLHVNQRLTEFLGYAQPDDLLGQAFTDFLCPLEESDTLIYDATMRVAHAQSNELYETRLKKIDGTGFFAAICGTCTTVEDQPASVVIVDNIDQRKQNEASARLAALVYESTSEAIVVTDEYGVVVDVNPAFTDITGYSLEEIQGNRMSLLASGRQGHDFYQRMWREINETGRWQGDIWNRRKNGEEYAERLNISTSWNADGTVYRRIGIFSDITSHKQREAIMWRQANYDHLTGLPNRQMFQERLQDAMQEADRLGTEFALIFLDLDLFKDVNDTLGHNVGDQLLEEVATRLTSCVRDTDTVARLGGDEFTVIVADVPNVEVVERICGQILTAIARPYLLGDELATVSASLGVTLYPEDGKDAGELLKNADMAMYAAKDCGRNQYCFFLPAMREAIQARMQFSRDLQRALEEEQFRLYYQPILDMRSGKLCHAEALIRWEHPELGLVPPSEFIPFAEDSGLIVDIGSWVFKAATRQAALWRQINPTFQITINVSPAQFYGQGVDVRKWVGHLAEIGLPSEAVIVEITERLLLEGSNEVTETLRAFRDAGLKIALDDFGTGFSSLTYLKRYPIDYLKIDQSFVRNLHSESDDYALCEAMIVMAHKLGIEVIAEGVSAEQHMDLLRRADCDYGQGYLFCRPIPAVEFEQWDSVWEPEQLLSLGA